MNACFGPSQPARGQIHVALLDGALHFIDSDTVRGETVRIHLNAHGILLRAENLHAGNAAHRSTSAARSSSPRIRSPCTTAASSELSAKYRIGCSDGFCLRDTMAAAASAAERPAQCRLDVLRGGIDVAVETN